MVPFKSAVAVCEQRKWKILIIIKGKPQASEVAFESIFLSVKIQDINEIDSVRQAARVTGALF